jgi:phosphate starvation-inducible protein PhoH
MARKVSNRKSKVAYADPRFHDNIVAITQGPKKKSWSVMDIKNIKPMTEPQRQMMESYIMDNKIFATGSAGTGKTLIAMWLALNTIFSKEFEQTKIIIVRSIVQTGKDIGALPGELHEKIAPFETPYKDICQFLMGKSSSYEDLKAAGKIEFVPTTFVRGITWDNAVVILDEIQNLPDCDIDSVATRIGETSRFIAIGDGKQDDLKYDKKTPSGFGHASKIFNYMDEVDVITFQVCDIVRGKFVKSYLTAKEELKL